MLRTQFEATTSLSQGTARGAVTPLSSFFLELSLERVFRALAGLGEIAVGAILHGIRIAVAELILHGVVAFLGTVVGLD